MKISRLLFQSGTPKQTVLKNIFWLVVGQAASRSMRAIVFIYAARVLGTSQYGVFSLAMSIVPLFMLFADAGVIPALSRGIAKDVDSRARWIATGFSAKVALLVLSLGATVVFAPYLTKIPGMRLLLLIVALVFFLDGIRDFGFWVVRALDETQWEAIVSVAGSTATVIAAFLFLSIANTPAHLALACLVGSAVGSFSILVPLRGFLVGLTRNLDVSLARLMLRTAWPYVIWATLGSLFLYADSIMLGFLRDARTVGIYNAASKPIQVFLALPELLAAGAFPTFARRAAQGDFLTPLSKSFSAMMLAALPLTFGGVVLARPIITMLYGSPYQESTLVFQILLLLILLQFPASIIGYAILAHDRHFEMIRPIAVGTGANLVLNWLLIPPYGAVGSAVAILLARAMIVGGVFTLLRKIQPVPVLGLLWRGLFATLVMVIGVGITAHAGVTLWVSVVLGAVSYLLALRLLREPLLREVGEVLR
ncbi:MAG TPA: oligosaccharide flippase family protein [bacterium]|nr:oligosaccharide flippase family protein [bacterium]